MRSHSNIIQRITALGIVICFSATSVFVPSRTAYAGSPMEHAALSGNLPRDLSALEIPKKLGELEETFQGASDESVILIRDAHSIPDAQRNIQKLIQFFAARYGVEKVGVEGAASKLDAQIFRSFPDQERLKKVIADYAEKGELAGSAMAAILGSTEYRVQSTEQPGRSTQYPVLSTLYFFGLEDWSLYEQGLGLYLAALDEQPKLLQDIRSQMAELKKEKKKLYPKELFEIDQALEEFYENRANLLEVLKALSVIQAPEAGSELALLLEKTSNQKPETSNQSAEIRSVVKEIESYFKQGAERRAQSAKGTAENQNPSAMRYALGGMQREFNSRYQEYQTSQINAEAFALHLKELIEKYNLPVRFSKKLKESAKEEKRMRDIEGSKLMRDFEEYADEVQRTEYRVPSDQKSVLSTQYSVLSTLHERTKELRLIEKLVKLELTKEEWNELKVGSRTSDVGRDLESQKTFYKNAEARDQAIFLNLSKHLNPHPTSNVSRPTILIAGGFHTEGLVEQLKAQGISYLLIRPAMQTIPEHSLYQQHMRGEVSWSKYFEIEDGKLDLYKAFVRAVRDQLLGLPNEAALISAEKNNQNQGRATRDRLLGVGADPRVRPDLDGQAQGPAPTVKIWRDQIIRDLANQNDIARSGEYTRFLDEAAGVKQDPKISEGLARLDKFIDGLKHLYDVNQVTPQNIINILKPATVSPMTAVPLSGNLVRAEIRNGKIEIAPFVSQGFTVLMQSDPERGTRVKGALERAAEISAHRTGLPIPPAQRERARVPLVEGVKFPAADPSTRMSLAPKASAKTSLDANPFEVDFERSEVRSFDAARTGLAQDGLGALSVTRSTVRPFASNAQTGARVTGAPVRAEVRAVPRLDRVPKTAAGTRVFARFAALCGIIGVLAAFWFILVPRVATFEPEQARLGQVLDYQGKISAEELNKDRTAGYAASATRVPEIEKETAKRFQHYGAPLQQGGFVAVLKYYGVNGNQPQFMSITSDLKEAIADAYMSNGIPVASPEALAKSPYLSLLEALYQYGLDLPSKYFSIPKPFESEVKVAQYLEHPDTVTWELVQQVRTLNNIPGRSEVRSLPAAMSTLVPRAEVSPRAEVRALAELADQDLSEVRDEGVIATNLGILRSIPFNQEWKPSTTEVREGSIWNMRIALDTDGKIIGYGQTDFSGDVELDLLQNQNGRYSIGPTVNKEAVLFNFEESIHRYNESRFPSIKIDASGIEGDLPPSLPVRLQLVKDVLPQRAVRVQVSSVPGTFSTVKVRVTYGMGEDSGTVERELAVGQSLTMGRDSESTIVIPETEEGVSRQHLKIYFDEQGLHFVDLGSTRGTKVLKARSEIRGLADEANEEINQMAQKRLLEDPATERMEEETLRAHWSSNYAKYAGFQVFSVPDLKAGLESLRGKETQDSDTRRAIQGAIQERENLLRSMETIARKQYQKSGLDESDFVIIPTQREGESSLQTAEFYGVLRMKFIPGQTVTEDALHIYKSNGEVWTAKKVLNRETPNKVEIEISKGTTRSEVRLNFQGAGDFIPNKVDFETHLDKKFPLLILKGFTVRVPDFNRLAPILIDLGYRVRGQGNMLEMKPGRQASNIDDGAFGRASGPVKTFMIQGNDVVNRDVPTETLFRVLQSGGDRAELNTSIESIFVDASGIAITFAKLPLIIYSSRDLIRLIRMIGNARGVNLDEFEDEMDQWSMTDGGEGLAGKSDIVSQRLEQMLKVIIARAEVREDADLILKALYLPQLTSIGTSAMQAGKKKVAFNGNDYIPREAVTYILALREVPVNLLAILIDSALKGIPIDSPTDRQNLAYYGLPFVVTENNPQNVAEQALPVGTLFPIVRDILLEGLRLARAEVRGNGLASSTVRPFASAEFKSTGALETGTLVVDRGPNAVDPLGRGVAIDSQNPPQEFTHELKLNPVMEGAPLMILVPFRETLERKTSDGRNVFRVHYKILADTGRTGNYELNAAQHDVGEIWVDYEEVTKGTGAYRKGSAFSITPNDQNVIANFKEISDYLRDWVSARAEVRSTLSDGARSGQMRGTSAFPSSPRDIRVRFDEIKKLQRKFRKLNDKAELRLLGGEIDELITQYEEAIREGGKWLLNSNLEPTSQKPMVEQMIEDAQIQLDALLARAGRAEIRAIAETKAPSGAKEKSEIAALVDHYGAEFVKRGFSDPDTLLPDTLERVLQGTVGEPLSVNDNPIRLALTDIGMAGSFGGREYVYLTFQAQGQGSGDVYNTQTICIVSSADGNGLSGKRSGLYVLQKEGNNRTQPEYLNAVESFLAKALTRDENVQLIRERIAEGAWKRIHDETPVHSAFFIPQRAEVRSTLFGRSGQVRGTSAFPASPRDKRVTFDEIKRMDDQVRQALWNDQGVKEARHNALKRHVRAALAGDETALDQILRGEVPDPGVFSFQRYEFYNSLVDFYSDERKLDWLRVMKRFLPGSDSKTLFRIYWDIFSKGAQDEEVRAGFRELKAGHASHSFADLIADQTTEDDRLQSQIEEIAKNLEQDPLGLEIRADLARMDGASILSSAVLTTMALSWGFGDQLQKTLESYAAQKQWGPLEKAFRRLRDVGASENPAVKFIAGQNAKRQTDPLSVDSKVHLLAIKALGLGDEINALPFSVIEEYFFNERYGNLSISWEIENLNDAYQEKLSIPQQKRLELMEKLVSQTDRFEHSESPPHLRNYYRVRAGLQEDPNGLVRLLAPWIAAVKAPHGRLRDFSLVSVKTLMGLTIMAVAGLLLRGRMLDTGFMAVGVIVFRTFLGFRYRRIEEDFVKALASKSESSQRSETRAVRMSLRDFFRPLAAGVAVTAWMPSNALESLAVEKKEAVQFTREDKEVRVAAQNYLTYVLQGKFSSLVVGEGSLAIWQAILDRIGSQAEVKIFMLFMNNLTKKAKEKLKEEGWRIVDAEIMARQMLILAENELFTDQEKQEAFKKSENHLQELIQSFEKAAQDKTTQLKDPSKDSFLEVGRNGFALKNYETVPPAFRPAYERLEAAFLQVGNYETPSENNFENLSHNLKRLLKAYQKPAPKKQILPQKPNQPNPDAVSLSPGIALLMTEQGQSLIPFLGDEVLLASTHAPSSIFRSEVRSTLFGRSGQVRAGEVLEAGRGEVGRDVPRQNVQLPTDVRAEVRGLNDDSIDQPLVHAAIVSLFEFARGQTTLNSTQTGRLRNSLRQEDWFLGRDSARYIANFLDILASIDLNNPNQLVKDFASLSGEVQRFAFKNELSSSTIQDVLAAMEKILSVYRLDERAAEPTTADSGLTHALHLAFLTLIFSKPGQPVNKQMQNRILRLVDKAEQLKQRATARGRLAQVILYFSVAYAASPQDIQSIWEALKEIAEMKQKNEQAAFVSAAESLMDRKMLSMPPLAIRRAEVRQEAIIRDAALMTELESLGDEVVDAFTAYVDVLKDGGEKGVVSSGLENRKGDLMEAIRQVPDLAPDVKAQNVAAYVRAAREIATRELAEQGAKEKPITPLGRPILQADEVVRALVNDSKHPELSSWLREMRRDPSFNNYLTGTVQVVYEEMLDSGSEDPLEDVRKILLAVREDWDEKKPADSLFALVRYHKDALLKERQTEREVLEDLKTKGGLNENQSEILRHVVRYGNISDDWKAFLKNANGQTALKLMDHMDSAIANSVHEPDGGLAKQLLTRFYNFGFTLMQLAWVGVGISVLGLMLAAASLLALKIIGGILIISSLAVPFVIRNHENTQKSFFLQMDFAAIDAGLKILAGLPVKSSASSRQRPDERALLAVPARAEVRSRPAQLIEERLFWAVRDLRENVTDSRGAILEVLFRGSLTDNILYLVLSGVFLLPAFLVQSAVIPLLYGIEGILGLPTLINPYWGDSEQELQFKAGRVKQKLQKVVDRLNAPVLVRDHRRIPVDAVLRPIERNRYSLFFINLGMAPPQDAYLKHYWKKRLQRIHSQLFEGPRMFSFRSELRTHKPPEVLTGNPSAIYHNLLRSAKPGQAKAMALRLAEGFQINRQSAGGGEQRAGPPSSSVVSPVASPNRTFFSRASRLLAILAVTKFFLAATSAMASEVTLRLGLTKSNDTVQVTMEVARPSIMQAVSPTKLVSAWIGRRGAATGDSTHFVQVLSDRPLALGESVLTTNQFPVQPGAAAEYFSGVASLREEVPAQSGGDTNLPPAETQSVTLAWSPSPDRTVTGYHLYYGKVGGSTTNKLNIGSALRAQVPGLETGSTYFFFATAYDAAGVESEPSNLITYTPQAVQNVLAPPTIIDPAYPFSVNSGASITDSILSTPATGLEFRVVRLPAHGTLNLSTNGTFIYTAPPRFNGTVSFEVQAVNSRGEPSNIVTVNLNVFSPNVIPEATTITSPLAALTNRTDLPPLTGTKKAGESIRIIHNNETVRDIQANNEITWSMSLSGLLVEGPNTLRVTVLNASGQESAPVVVQMTLDRTPPVITFTAPPPSTVYDPFFELRYRVDNGAEQTKSFTLNLGTNPLSVPATDPAGNQAIWNGSVVFALDAMGHPGTLGSGAAFLAEGGIQFDGTPNSYVSFTDSPAFDVRTDDFSLEASIRFATENDLPKNGEYQAIMGQWAAPDQKSYGFFLHRENDKLYAVAFYTVNGIAVLGPKFLIDTPPVGANAWIPVKMSRNGRMVSVDVNGNRAGEIDMGENISLHPSASQFTLGASNINLVQAGNNRAKFAMRDAKMTHNGVVVFWVPGRSEARSIPSTVDRPQTAIVNVDRRLSAVVPSVGRAEVRIAQNKMDIISSAHMQQALDNLKGIASMDMDGTTFAYLVERFVENWNNPQDREVTFDTVSSAIDDALRQGKHVYPFRNQSAGHGSFSTLLSSLIEYPDTARISRKTVVNWIKTYLNYQYQHVLRRDGMEFDMAVEGKLFEKKVVDEPGVEHSLSWKKYAVDEGYKMTAVLREGEYTLSLISPERTVTKKLSEADFRSYDVLSRWNLPRTLGTLYKVLSLPDNGPEKFMELFVQAQEQFARAEVREGGLEQWDLATLQRARDSAVRNLQSAIPVGQLPVASEPVIRESVRAEVRSYQAAIEEWVQNPLGDFRILNTEQLEALISLAESPVSQLPEIIRKQPFLRETILNYKGVSIDQEFVTGFELAKGTKFQFKQLRIFRGVILRANTEGVFQVGILAGDILRPQTFYPTDFIGEGFDRLFNTTTIRGIHRLEAQTGHFNFMQVPTPVRAEVRLAEMPQVTSAPETRTPDTREPLSVTSEPVTRESVRAEIRMSAPRQIYMIESEVKNGEGLHKKNDIDAALLHLAKTAPLLIGDDGSYLEVGQTLELEIANLNQLTSSRQRSTWLLGRVDSERKLASAGVIKVQFDDVNRQFEELISIIAYTQNVQPRTVAAQQNLLNYIKTAKRIKVDEVFVSRRIQEALNSGETEGLVELDRFRALSLMKQADLDAILDQFDGESNAPVQIKTNETVLEILRNLVHWHVAITANPENMKRILEIAIETSKINRSFFEAPLPFNILRTGIQTNPKLVNEVALLQLVEQYYQEFLRRQQQEGEDQQAANIRFAISEYERLQGEIVQLRAEVGLAKMPAVTSPESQARLPARQGLRSEARVLSGDSAVRNLQSAIPVSQLASEPVTRESVRAEIRLNTADREVIIKFQDWMAGLPDEKFYKFEQQFRHYGLLEGINGYLSSEGQPVLEMSAELNEKQVEEVLRWVINIEDSLRIIDLESAYARTYYNHPVYPISRGDTSEATFSLARKAKFLFSPRFKKRVARISKQLPISSRTNSSRNMRAVLEDLGLKPETADLPRGEFVVNQHGQLTWNRSLLHVRSSAEQIPAAIAWLNGDDRKGLFAVRTERVREKYRGMSLDRPARNPVEGLQRATALLEDIQAGERIVNVGEELAPAEVLTFIRALRREVEILDLTFAPNSSPELNLNFPDANELKRYEAEIGKVYDLSSGMRRSEVRLAEMPAVTSRESQVTKAPETRAPDVSEKLSVISDRPPAVRAEVREETASDILLKANFQPMESGYFLNKEFLVQILTDASGRQYINQIFTHREKLPETVQLSSPVGEKGVFTGVQQGATGETFVIVKEEGEIQFIGTQAKLRGQASEKAYLLGYGTEKDRRGKSSDAIQLKSGMLTYLIDSLGDYVFQNWDTSAEGVFPRSKEQALELVKTPDGFVIGGANESDVIQRLVTLNGLGLDEEIKSINGQTMTVKESLIQNNIFVKSLNYTHQELAEVLFYVVNFVMHTEGYNTFDPRYPRRFKYRGQLYHVTADPYLGVERNLFADGSERERHDVRYKVINEETHAEVMFSSRTPDYIERYGLYVRQTRNGIQSFSAEDILKVFFADHVRSEVRLAEVVVNEVFAGKVTEATADQLAVMDIPAVLDALNVIRAKLRENPGALAGAEASQYHARTLAFLDDAASILRREVTRKGGKVILAAPEGIQKVEVQALVDAYGIPAQKVLGQVEQFGIRAKGDLLTKLISMLDVRHAVSEADLDRAKSEKGLLPVIHMGSHPSTEGLSNPALLHIQFGGDAESRNMDPDTMAAAVTLKYMAALIGQNVTNADQLKVRMAELLSKLGVSQDMFQGSKNQFMIIPQVVRTFIEQYRAELRVQQAA